MGICAIRAISQQDIAGVQHGVQLHDVAHVVVEGQPSTWVNSGTPIKVANKPVAASINPITLATG
jgi:hypothetical protein